MKRTAIIVSGERGDCVVAGVEVRAVVGGRVETIVVGTSVCTWSCCGDNVECFHTNISFCIPERYI